MQCLLFILFYCFSFSKHRKVKHWNVNSVYSDQANIAWFTHSVLYNFACHFTTTDRIVMKFWILIFQWQSSILYFWSQAYGPPELVVNVLWKWLIQPILQRNWAKTSNPVTTMGPGVNLTFFGPIGLVFMWKECLHEKISSTSNFFFCPLKFPHLIHCLPYYTFIMSHAYLK